MAMGVGDSERVFRETNDVDDSENMNPMTIEELDVEGDYVIQHDEVQRVEVRNNNDNTILELKRLVQTMASSVATAVTKIEELSYKQLELSSTMMEFQHHNKEMCESLKLMEVAVCLKENDVFGSHVTPNKIGSDAFDMVVGRMDNHISQPMMLWKSNFRRSSNSEPIGSAVLTGITKKLFQSPSHRSKIPVTNPYLQPRPSPVGRGKTRVNEVRPFIPRVMNLTLPRGIKWRFKPTPEMHLSPLEVQVCAYVFHPDQDADEPLMTTHNMVATRADIECLCPGKPIKDVVLSYVAGKTCWVQKNLSHNAVWVMPPTFHEDVFNGATLYELMDNYTRHWMVSFQTLKYIYIPVKNILINHWYLMVVSLKDETVYQLDSYLRAEDIESRRATIKTLAEVMSQMVNSSYFATVFMGCKLDFQNWDIKEARGIPNCGRSNNSLVWLLEWLEMEHSFNHNVHGTINENAVRMRTCMSILLGLHNELRSHLEVKSMTFWETLPH
ncbi:putative Ulp1 protease family catalytic domain-containing protein [Medicago truncatula]|uniref:Putative Ulp1 protease family catalytic domain-containing protein n=1 Tax=Medicago truncatula TaxID=3880 RepID=G7K006_MEDTR|nr:uncharacterized protein LOC11415504 [Medicago truncatula]AES95273.1 Ulp1 protease family, carboxy-terminal domain protein [Medicago truncatula]RHN54424.1 putative Ulp1 protease family catalytic domain-containing protein [Medicago truncatula]